MTATAKPPRQYWSAADLKVVGEMYPDHATEKIATLLGRSVESIYHAAHNLGLAKSAAYLGSEEYTGKIHKGQRIGRQFEFPEGHVPFNKGLRRPGWHRGRMKETQFKKGQRSGMAARNWVPVGTILPDSEGYLRIKVREATHGKEATGFGKSKVWPMYNRYLWEQFKGPIPPEHLVIFKDGNRAHCVIENLELISMGENARRNRMWNRLPRELAETIHLNGVLKRKLRRLSNGKEQNQRSQGSSV